MDKLAWRAKWRKRWHRWKTVLFVLVVLIIFVPSFLAFTPWAPDMVCEWIEKNRTDPITQQVKPVAAERMYNLAMFYYFTMREDKAMETWDKLTQWYYGYSMRRWAARQLTRAERSRRTIKKNKLAFDPDAERYVGFAVFRMGEYLKLKKHRDHAARLLRHYLDEWADKKGADPKFNQQASTIIALIGAKGG